MITVDFKDWKLKPTIRAVDSKFLVECSELCLLHFFKVEASFIAAIDDIACVNDTQGFLDHATAGCFRNTGTRKLIECIDEFATDGRAACIDLRWILNTREVVGVADVKKGE